MGTRLSTAVIPAVVAGCFGPYLMAGIRTEQLGIYMLGVGSVLWVAARLAVPASLARFGVPWLALVVVAGAATFGSPAGPASLGRADGMLLPLAMAAGTAIWIDTRPDPDRARELLSGTIVTALAANSVVAIVSLVAPLDGVLRMFWSTSEHQSVAERAAQLSRISGVFNQPLEAGVAYSVGALMLVYLVTRGRLTRALRIAAAGLIVIGGVLPISKTFILVGLPIAAFVLLASRPGARRLGAAATMLVLAGVLAGVIGALPWQGSARLVDLLQPGDPEQNVVALYSAGRFGDEGTIGEVAAAIYQQAPVAGFGLADPGLVTDNAWVEIMSYGGVVALVIYTFAFLWWAALWWRNRSRTPAWWAGGGILAVVLIAGLGGPVLTLNRAGPLAVAAMVGFALPRRSQAGHLGPSDVPDRRASIVFAG